VDENQYVPMEHSSKQTFSGEISLPFESQISFPISITADKKMSLLFKQLLISDIISLQKLSPILSPPNLNVNNVITRAPRHELKFFVSFFHQA
jgi:hypothetical protein